MDSRKDVLSIWEKSVSETIIESWKLYLEDCNDQDVKSAAMCNERLSAEELLCLSKIAASTLLSHTSILLDRISADIRFDTV